MVNEKIRGSIAKVCPEALVFDNQSSDNSIIGTCSGRVVYDYDKMVEELMTEWNTDYEEAREWIDYNTVRSLGYYPMSPIIAIRDEDDDTYHDLAYAWADEDEADDYPVLEIIKLEV